MNKRRWEEDRGTKSEGVASPCRRRRGRQHKNYTVVASALPENLVDRVAELHAIAAQASAGRAEPTQGAIEGSPS
jgi:hypothetical protein